MALMRLLTLLVCLVCFLAYDACGSPDMSVVGDSALETAQAADDTYAATMNHLSAATDGGPDTETLHKINEALSHALRLHKDSEDLKKQISDLEGTKATDL